MTEPKLKPCPFCGSEAITFEDNPMMGWSIACDNEKCRANVGYFDTEQEAIEAWNKRVPQRTATMKVYDSFGG